MRYKKTADNQLSAKPRPCLRCDKPTLFTSTIKELEGKVICPECDKALKKLLKRRVAKKRLKTQTKKRNGRGTNQYQVKRRRGRPAKRTIQRDWRAWALILFWIVFLLLLLGAWIQQRNERGITRQKVDAQTIVSPVASPTPTATPTSAPIDTELEAFLRRVHRKESSSGRNTNPGALHNICKSQGKSNEMGWGGMAMLHCFDSHEQAMARVARWYQEHRATRTEAQTYCYYNLGLNLDTCPYWEEVRAW